MIDNLISIGKVAKTFGIKGQLKINLNKDIIDIDDLVGVKVYLNKENTDVYDFYKINFHQIISNKVVIGFENINSINEVTKLINSDIYVVKDSVEIEYEVSLIDYSVLLENNKIGVVIDTMFNGSHDIIKVKLDTGKDIWIPDVDHFIIEVNVDDKKISVKNIEGL